MKLKMVVVAETIFFLCVSMTSLFAQTGPSAPPSAEQGVVQQPATKEEIDALKKKIETMKLQQERMHNTDVRVRQAETEKLGHQIADANAKLDAMNREAMLRQQAMERTQTHAAYIAKIESLSGSGVAVLLILGAIFFVRRDRKVQSMKEATTPAVEEDATDWNIKDVDDPFSLLTSNIHIASLCVDPPKEEVVKYEPPQQGAPFIIILRLASTVLVPCIIQKVDGKVPLVFHSMEGLRTSDRKPNSTWKHRKSHAEIVRRPDYISALRTDISESVH